MKKVILSLVIFISLISCTSVKDLGYPEPKYKIVNNNKTKENNYIKANEWMVNTFHSAESVVQFSDKEEGIIKGKYLLEGTTNRYASITIWVKDNASKINIEAFDNLTSVVSMGKEYGYTREEYEADINPLLESFYNTMLKDSSVW